MKNIVLHIPLQVSMLVFVKSPVQLLLLYSSYCADSIQHLQIQCIHSLILLKLYTVAQRNILQINNESMTNDHITDQ